VNGECQERVRLRIDDRRMYCSIYVMLSRFKLFLEPKALRNDAEIDPRLPSIPVCGYYRFLLTRLLLKWLIFYRICNLFDDT